MKRIIYKIWMKVPDSIRYEIMEYILRELTIQTKWVDSVDEFGGKVTVNTLRERIEFLRLVLKNKNNKNIK